MQKPKNKFDWGYAVKIKREAPNEFHPGEIVSVCAIVEISSEDLKLDPTLIEPTWLYTVEFGNGNSIEVPECYLEPCVGLKISGPARMICSKAIK